MCERPMMCGRGGPSAAKQPTDARAMKMARANFMEERMPIMSGSASGDEEQKREVSAKCGAQSMPWTFRHDISKVAFCGTKRIRTLLKHVSRHESSALF